MTEAAKTILVIDDEKLVCKMMTRVANTLGYDVITCTSSAAALRAFTTMHKSIGLIIIDLVMPDMYGTDLLSELRAINPNVKALISSGLSNQESQKMEYSETTGFIQKPFTISEISAKIHRALNVAEVSH